MLPINTEATSNKVVALRPVAQSQRRVQLDAVDRQFLPGVLELLETPPSAIHIRLLCAICALFTVALAWSWFGRIDIHAVASGRVQPVGRTKLVQPLETGKIKTLAVENGTHVHAGDFLAEIDPTEILAERDSARANLMAAEAEIVRRHSAMRSIRSRLAIEINSDLQFPDMIDDMAVREREKAVLKADLTQLVTNIESLNSQIKERKATIRRLEISVTARGRVISPLKDRLNMRQALMERNSGTRADVITALHDYEEERTKQAAEDGQIGEAEAAIVSLEQKQDELVVQFIADNTNKLAEVARRRDEVRQTFIKASARNERTKLYAPVAGVVQELSVTTAGQVVTIGQQLMSIVPDGGSLEVEAMVVNSDIGFVENNQVAALKIDAFPFTRYGTLPGRVTRVSTDAIDMRQAGMRPGANTGTSPAAQDGARPTQVTQGLVFPITVTPAQSFMFIDGKRIPLVPGMEVTVEIRTGERRIIEYLLSPLVEIFSNALRER